MEFIGPLDKIFEDSEFDEKHYQWDFKWLEDFIEGNYKDEDNSLGYINIEMPAGDVVVEKCYRLILMPPDLSITTSEPFISSKLLSIIN